jgi:glycosyltransferase involved in cell wall biosynthesis
MVTTVSPPLAEMLRSMCDAPVHVVYNGFDPDDGARLAPESIFPADGVFRVAYTGTLYPVRQDPTPFFAALAHLQRERIVGPGTFEVVIAGACAPLLDIAERFGVRALVTHRGMLTKSDALRMQRDAQALLLIGFRGAGQEGVLSGKIFEYLSAGPPVLAVTADESSSIGEMLHETGRGVALGSSVEAIAAQLRAWIAQSHAARRGDSNVLDERVLRYTRERQAMQLLEILQPRLSGAYADG